MNTSDISKSYSNLFRAHSDINIMNFGRGLLKKGEEIEKKVLEHYSFYYISKGKIRLYIDNKKYTVEGGQLFLSPALTSTGFVAESEEPTIFYWVGFWGAEAKSYIDRANLTAEMPIFKRKDERFEQYFNALLEECMAFNEESDLRALGYLYLILSTIMSIDEKKLTDQQALKLSYAKKAVEFIRRYYMQNITIQDISDYLALNRTYFSGIFKDVIGIPPIIYLMKYRIDQASILLTNPLLSINQIADLVGFSDHVSFTRRFKAFNGVSPSEYRKLVFDKYAPRLRERKDKQTKS